MGGLGKLVHLEGMRKFFVLSRILLILLYVKTRISSFFS